MIKIDVKKANKHQKNLKKDNFRMFGSFLDKDKFETYIQMRDCITEIMTSEGIFGELDKINMYDKEVLQLFHNVYTMAPKSIHIKYIFERLHREFPQFSCTLDDFILIVYAISSAEPIRDIIGELSNVIITQIKKVEEERLREKKNANE